MNYIGNRIRPRIPWGVLGILGCPGVFWGVLG